MYKVVVVEDESMVRKGIILTIDWSALDCVVVGDAANGEEGVELVDRLKPDIVVSDVKMPRMDGVEMIEQLRKQGVQSKIYHFDGLQRFQIRPERPAVRRQ